MGKGIPNGYGSSRGPHTGPSHPEPHVDIYRYDENGNEIKAERQHIPAQEWVWEKPQSDKGVGSAIITGIGNILKGGKNEEP